MYWKKHQFTTLVGYNFIFKINGLLVMNKSVFNFKNMMDMHKGYAYQIYNSSFLKGNLEEQNLTT
jgi:hypothetical protein